jgi:hypothetical protein
MTDVDYQADLALNYVDHELHAVIPLTAPVSEMWGKRYEALAQAKNVQALVRPRREGPAMLLLTVPAKMRGDDVEALLETARALIAEADAVDQQPASSTAPEAVVREWWARQQT